MDTLDEELQNIGFSDDYVKAIRNAEEFDMPDIEIENINFQSFENDMVSTTELEVTNTPTTYTNYIIEDEIDF